MTSPDREERLAPRRRGSGRAGVLFLALALVVWGAAWIAGSGRPEPDLLPFLKRAWPLASYERQSGGGYVVRRQGEVLGYGAAASRPGYGGPITVAVASTPEGTLHAVAILEYRDTPGLRPSLQPLLAAIAGRGVGDPLAIGDDIDAVTGATLSSRGVAAAAREAAAKLAARADRADPRSAAGAPEIALVALFALALASRHNRRLGPRARRALRWSALAASLATIGFLWNRPYVLALPLRLATGELPGWRADLFGYLLIGLLLVGFDRTGRGVWCPWLCPFGAAQELVGLAGGAHRRAVPAASRFLWVKRALLLVAVALALFYRSPGGGSYEVFATLFRGRGSGPQIAILVFVGVAALFVLRPFCHWLCPVDLLERALRAARRAGLRALGKFPKPEPPHGSPRLPVVARRQVRDPLRVLRDRVLIGVGLFCALLVVVHLATTFGSMSEGSQAGLMSETLVVASGGGS